MFKSFKDAIKALSKNEQIGFFTNIVGIMVGFVAAQYSVIAGAIIFLTFFVSFVVILMYSLYVRDIYGGLYETLYHQNVWELVDAEGKEVLHTKKMKIKFIQNNVISIPDYVWGDGDCLVDYICEPGKIADVYQSGSRTNVLVSLRESKKRGDVMDLIFRRKILNGFMNDSEWVEVDFSTMTKDFELLVIFPKNRPCKRATLTIRSKVAVSEIDNSKFKVLDDGRHALALNFKNPPIREMYTVRWDW